MIVKQHKTGHLFVIDGFFDALESLNHNFLSFLDNIQYSHVYIKNCYNYEKLRILCAKTCSYLQLSYHKKIKKQE